MNVHHKVLAFEWIHAVADTRTHDDKRQPEITVITKTGGPLTKQISLMDDGLLKSDGSGCRLINGTARRQPISDVTQLAFLIESLQSDQAITLGALRSGVSNTVEVKTK